MYVVSHTISQGWIHYGPWTKSGPESVSLFFFKIKFYWNAAILISLHIVYGGFLITTTELSSCDGDFTAHEA